MPEWGILTLLRQILETLKALLALLQVIVGQLPSDLQIITKGTTMAKQKVTSFLKPKGKVGQVMPPVTITNATDSIALVVVDQNGNPINNIDMTTVTTKLVSDNPAFAITNVDELHYVASIPPGTTGTANLSATLTFNSGSPGPFTASVACTLNIPPTPLTPTDLQIIIS